MRPLSLTALVALAVASLPQPSGAGSFVTVNEDEPGRIAHQNYFGTGGELAAVRVCIDSSISPGLAAAAEPAVRNVIATYNRFRSLPDNTFAAGADTSAPADQVDFETVLLHELLHAHGLDHPNQADNPAGNGTSRYDDTRSGGGANGVLDHLGDADGIPGSGDDQRGDDVSLAWFARGSNDPAALPAIVDTTTMARTLDDLPPGQHFAANGNAAVMAALGYANSEAAAVQGYVQGRVQHHLHSDDLAMLQLARAGLDGIAGTADDYRSTAVFAGYYNNPQGGECSIVVRFDDDGGRVGFAATLVGLTPLAPDHWRLIYPTRMRFNPAVNWYFTPGPNTVVQIDPATPGTNSGLAPYAVQVTVGKAGYNPMNGTPRGTVIVRDGDRQDAQTAACSIDLTPASGGTGSCTLAPLAAGHKTLTADYVGWGGWDGNTATATHESSGTVEFSNVTRTPAPSAIGVDVDFGWTLAAPANAAPVQATGAVVVKEAADCASAPVDPSHQCTATLPAHTCSIRFASSGTHTMQLCYGGDSAVAPASTSVIHNVLAGRATTTGIVAPSSGPTQPFEPYTVQVQVRETPDLGGRPQGIVVVSDGDADDLLTARCAATLTGATNETASCQLASNRAGSHTLTASFAAQGAWAASSAQTTHDVRRFAIVGNQPSSTPLGQAASITVALDVRPFNAAPAPTGIIVVGDGADSCEIVLPARQCLWRSSTVGTHHLTAAWSGDANYPAMVTSAVTQTVTPGSPYPTLASQALSGYPTSNAASTGSNQGLSADGRFVVFSSIASDLVGDDSNGVEDVFVRDQLSGAVRRVSVTADGTQGNGASRFPSISANGRYVSFQSEASNFFPGDGSDKDVFVKDLYSGALVRATTRADGSAPTSAELASLTLRSSLSADGRYVAFSTYRALAPGDSNGRVDAYVKDLATGALDLVSSNAADQPGDNHSQFPAISADGRYVVYNSTAGNLVPNFTANSTSNRVFVKDRLTRASDLASAAADGTPADNSCNDYPAISADGRFVAFQCNSTNLPISGWSGNRVFVKDMGSGAIELAAQGNLYNNSLTPALSADGRYVAFQLGVVASPNYVGVFVKDRQTGAMVNQHVTPGGAAALEEQVSWETRLWPSISADGRFVAFQSVSSTIVPPDGNGAADVFVRDRTLGLTQRASGALSGPRNDADSGNAAISRDGSLVAYDSWSTRLIDADTNGVRDVFLRRTDTTAITRLSIAADGTPGNGASFAPAYADDAGDVYFLSAASNLVAGDTNGKVDVFRKHLADGSIERMNLYYGSQTPADAQAPLAVSRDGKYLAFASADTNLSADHNGYTDILVYPHGGNAFMPTPGSNGNSMQPSISDDGRILAFASDATNLGVGGNAVRNVFARNLREVYLPDRLQLVSTDAGGVAGNGNSEQPAVSADGRYVAFVSWATNLVPGDDNGAADIFVKDLQTGAVERVNTSAPGAQGTGGDCASPSFSSGARFVGFVCAQGNLVADGDGTPHFYVKDRATGAIRRLSQTAAGMAANAASSAWPHALGDNGLGAFASRANNLTTPDGTSVSNVFLSQYPATFAASAVSIVSISPEHPEVGRGYTVNVSVAGAGAQPPTGRVRIFDGTEAYTSCEATLTPGTPSTGSCNLSTGASGRWALSAWYGGDDANGAASSLPYPVDVQHQVLPAQPIITAAAPGNGSVTLQIGYSGIGSPFIDYTATCGTGSTIGVASPLSVTGLANDVEVSCHVTARNASGIGAPSNVLKATPAPARTRTTLALSSGDNPSPHGQTLTFTATVEPVAPASAIPTGTVAFHDGVAPIAGCAAVALTTTAPITAECTTAALSVGDHALVARYGGDATYTASAQPASNTLDHAVQRAVGTVDFGTLEFTYDGTPKTIAATLREEPGAQCTVTPSNVGPGAGSTPVTATCNGTNYTGSSHAVAVIARAIGTVDFGTLDFLYDGNARTVTAHIHDEPATSCTVTPSSVGPGAGSTPVTAVCHGTNYTASGHATATIAKAAATLTLGGLSASYDGQPHAVTVTTEPPDLSVTVTYDAATTAPTNAGSYDVVATVDDPNYQGSRNATLVIAQAATTLTLSSPCMRTFVAGQPFTLVATLAGGVGATGNVDFDDGHGALCSDVHVDSGTATCRATLSVHGQPVAPLALGARYDGDGGNAPSEAKPLAVTVLELAEAVFRNGFENPEDPDACPIE